MNVEQMEVLKEQKELEAQQLLQRLADVQAEIQTLGENIHFARNGHLRREMLARIEAQQLAAHQRQQEASRLRAEKDAEHLAKLNSNVDVSQQIREEMRQQFGWHK